MSVVATQNVSLHASSTIKEDAMGRYGRAEEIMSMRRNRGMLAAPDETATYLPVVHHMFVFSGFTRPSHDKRK
jgi:hypothetical protein